MRRAKILTGKKPTPLILWGVLSIALMTSACSTSPSSEPSIVYRCPSPPAWLMTPPRELETIEMQRELEEQQDRETRREMGLPRP